MFDALDRGREAFLHRAWEEAFSQLSEADGDGRLAPDDLEMLALVAFLVGHDQVSAGVRERAHLGHLHQGNLPAAFRCAFWLGMEMMNRGEMAQGSGWLARAKRVLDDLPDDCLERGYMLVPQGLQLLGQGDASAAREAFEGAARYGDRFGDTDLQTLGRLGQGQALVRQGRPAEGVPLLDEAMVTAVDGEASPIVSGIVYCAVIITCQETFDLRRAQEWTAALTRWCDAQPDLVPFRGQCLVHRSEIMQLRGSWQEAMREALKACERLSDPPGQPALGMAFYQRAELHRLRGEFPEAEEGYRQASYFGHPTQPGLAQLRLAQGQLAAAAAALGRTLDETEGTLDRSKLLGPYVETMLAVGDLEAARQAAEELASIAETLNSPVFDAVSARATGAALLAQGEARSALTSLRRAWTEWQEIEVPYEAARVRVLMGLACRSLGDEDTARMELDSARRAFEELGAAQDLARVQALLGRPEDKAGAKAAGGLTPREVEVLRRVASGKTNRAIADDLVLSEKTVARHISNIFGKLGLSSRSAATAYAYEHGLL